MSADHTTISPKDKNDWNVGTAYIVETRAHSNLARVLNNAHLCLPKAWQIYVFCGPDNKQLIEDALNDIDRITKTIELSRPNIDLLGYNQMLLSEEFWLQFETENLLGFQVDSLMNISQKHRLKNIAEYDYVGAPWSDSIRRRWSYIPELGGNGGVCFSKKSARLKALREATIERNTGAPHHQQLNEDIWFSCAIVELGLLVPTRDVASRFLVESIYTDKPFAVHKPWRYLSARDYDLLARSMPGLETLREACAEPRKYQPEPVDYRKFLHRFARECMQDENYYEADLAIQVCQSRFPDDAIAWNLQAMLGFRLGLYEQALGFVGQALDRQANFKKAIENKSVIERVAKRVGRADALNQECSYLLIHSWGSGMGFDLLYLLQQLMLAEMTGREPVVHWGDNCLYNPNPETNCFTDYFDPISDVNLSEIKPLQKTAYPEYWQQQPLDQYLRRTRWRNKVNTQLYRITPLYFLNRSEALLVAGEFTSIKTMQPWLAPQNGMYRLNVGDTYRYLMAKYIKPKPHLQSAANAFVKTQFGARPFIAIHLRGTDKYREKQSNNLAEINQRLIAKLESLGGNLPIFVMSDDKRQIATMTNLFSERVKSVDVTRSEDNDLGVHLSSNNKSKIANEVLVDVLIAEQAEYFFGCGFSYLACVVAYRRTKHCNTTLVPYDVMTRFSDIPIPGTYGIE